MSKPPDTFDVYWAAVYVVLVMLGYHLMTTAKLNKLDAKLDSLIEQRIGS